MSTPCRERHPLRGHGSGVAHATWGPTRCPRPAHARSREQRHGLWNNSQRPTLAGVAVTQHVPRLQISGGWHASRSPCLSLVWCSASHGCATVQIRCTADTSTRAREPMRGARTTWDHCCCCCSSALNWLGTCKVMRSPGTRGESSRRTTRLQKNSNSS